MTTKIISKITQKQINQIINLVEKDADLISINVFEKQSPIYEYLKVRESEKCKIYLSRVGTFDSKSTNLIITEDLNGDLLGFILFQNVINQQKDIAIISTIVSSSHRNKGILKNMMNNLKQSYDSISLSCFTDIVHVYSKLGFKPAGQWQTQIGLYFGYMDDGQIISVDDNDLNNLPAIKYAFQNFKNKNINTWQNLIDKLNEDNNKEQLKASQFIKHCF
ncbi:GNAT family N-acetyltransferase [Flavobacterium sp. JAS]|uniref:GNAT family N-acetyltransferase n=1 Tax=Flavobacterium sp. JAS TaxID=2897329 RepID=UPI001E3C5D94|nr:GNAT family N-acetyltransferase [Flavobacterium sp. JAS]MCD0472574.1 GNAT family N-acetyltransferase [Flavobacterium sp. JAS]